jgi:hypothetical protein
VCSSDLSAVLLVFAIYPHLLILLSRWMGVYYLTTVMLAAFLFLMLLGLRLGMSISHLTDDGRKMAQRIALLEQQLQQHTGRAREAASPDEPPRTP